MFGGSSGCLGSDDSDPLSALPGGGGSEGCSDLESSFSCPTPEISGPYIDAAEDELDPRNRNGSYGKIAVETGHSIREVRDAIHRVKDNLPRDTGIRNPEVDVDVTTGEVYPRTPDGGHGDSIGNIHDYLPD
jgi:hypothetical protein